MGRQKTPVHVGAGRSVPVPYITEWSAERAPRMRVVAKRGGIGYADERPYDRDTDGVLWLLGEDPEDRGSWPADLTTTHPPLCMPCAVSSVRASPHLRERYVALRVRAFGPAGVRGALYRPGYPSPVAVDAAGVAFDDPRIHWIRAGQLIMRLHEFTVVDLVGPNAGRAVDG
ncbi:hypothetical protein [Streptomyces sp. NPDC058280]|uniref:hypothetical protein n=1 Tax=Streptomyces sp. NPDC058280 TaxID=3346419 RepID=UPI0036F14E7C